MSTHVSIDSTQRVIQKDNVGIEVDGASNIKTLLLSSADSNTSLSNFSLITIRQHLKIRSESTSVYDSFVPLRIEWAAENNIFPDSRILNPRVLGTVGHRSTLCYRPRG